MHLDFQVAQTPVRTILEYLSLFLGMLILYIGKKELVIIGISRYEILGKVKF
jgi:hypothetical protein